MLSTTPRFGVTFVSKRLYRMTRVIDVLTIAESFPYHNCDIRSDPCCFPLYHSPIVQNFSRSNYHGLC